MEKARFCRLWHINARDLFAGLTDEEKSAIGEVFDHTRVRKKDFVYAAGDVADTVYVVLEGRIKITRLTEDGRELTLDILEPGDIFGELALAGEEERETTAEALEDSTLCSMKREKFLDFASKNPVLTLSVTKWIGGRLRKIENRLETLVFQDVRSRIMALMEDLAARYGRPAERGTVITLRLSHQEIASLVGSTRETVTAEINRLKREGRLAAAGHLYVIPAEKTN